MLTASSPINFPPTSSPPSTKRQRPVQDGPRPKSKVTSGFVVDDESSDDSETDETPPFKKLQTTSTAGLPSQLSQPNRTPAAPQEHTIPGQNTQESRLPFSQPDPTDILPSLVRYSAFKSAGTKYTIRTCSGKSAPVKHRTPTANTSYEHIVAARTKTKEGRAKKGYYGIDINDLKDNAAKEIEDANAAKAGPRTSDEAMESIEAPIAHSKKPKKTLLWTEKYRARTFMDLCGDDGTNRMVLRWLKRWDPLVFPGAAKKAPAIRRPGYKTQTEEEKPHRKILMLTGPPGLGKTTLAHVCARQAGYEVTEINASDERSRDVVRNRIRTCLGTETVKSVENKKSSDGQAAQKVARPACVVVDEVDGVVGGSSGSGEGGFVKALIDLVLIDQKNSSAGALNPTSGNRNKKKGDDFRLMRPLILICNDVYHPSLKPLRQSNMAEIIHVGKPSIEAVVNRLNSVFLKEGIPCEKDAARKICETAWGMTSGIDAKRGAQSGAEGDLRGVMVVGEWVAGRYRSTATAKDPRLTRQWLDKHVVQDLANGAGGARGVGRGSAKDIVSRVFQEGGGFPKVALDTKQAKNKHEQPMAQLGFSEHHKKHAMDRLHQMISTSGEIDRVLTDIMLEYPNREFNDDLYLSKPNAAYDWVAFHDACSSRLFSSQEWELAPYISQPILACHDLFASPKRHVANAGYDKKWGTEAVEEEVPLPFTGPRADYEAFEAEKRNRAVLQAIQAELSPMLVRSFRSPEDVAVEFLPYLVRMLSPDVKPVVVGGSGDQKGVASVRKDSEKAMVKRAADVMVDVGIELQRGKVESDSANRAPQWVYRMEPDLDALSAFETASGLLLTAAPTRYAVRQVLDQEIKVSMARRENASRQARFMGGGGTELDLRAHALAQEDLENERKRKKEAEKEALLRSSAIKRDFFGRVIETPLPESTAALELEAKKKKVNPGDRKVWVTYHEGMNNAVRKPISMMEMLKGL